MKPQMITRKDCRLCHSNELQLVLKLAPTPIADSYLRIKTFQELFPLDVFLCRKCGFVQLLDVVQAKHIYLEYIYETVSSLGLVQHFDEYAKDVINRINPPAKSLVIDIGSNDGTLLKSYKKKGFKVLGIDPAREIATRASDNGVETIPDFLTVDLANQIRKEKGQASIITANNVIANIDDLDEIAESVYTMLDPNGVFVFESYYLGDLINNLVFDFIYHEHISSFSVKPISLFFKRHGMELIDLQRVPTKGGSLRYIIQRSNGPRKISPVVNEMLENEKIQGLDRPEVYKAFNSRIEIAKRDTLEILQQYKRNGKSVIGYGASATTTTLIYHFEIGKYLDFLVDDYPAKQGTFSPGMNLPVLSSDQLYHRRPDAVLILAWRYQKDIIRRHREYLENGGVFIIPMPQIEVVKDSKSV
jgi:SAM-dependent methyltransferase